MVIMDIHHLHPKPTHVSHSQWKLDTLQQLSPFQGIHTHDTGSYHIQKGTTSNKTTNQPETNKQNNKREWMDALVQAHIYYHDG